MLELATRPSRSAIAAAIDAVQALSRAIHDLGRPIPEGELYARVMAQIDLRTFDAVLGLIERAGLIRREAHLIRWTGPRLPVEASS